jgi:hypothetical protein
MASVPSGRSFASRYLRALIGAGALATLAACTNGESLASNAQGSLSCTPGPQGVGTLGPCCGKVALEKVASTLTVDTCDGTFAYAICDGYNFSCEYVCSLPAGYTVQAPGAQQGCSEGGGASDAPSAHPVPFDGGNLDLGPCSGHVVALIPAAACPDRCPGSLAYAVCDGSAYGECACNIPAGYALTALSEGGAPDARVEARPEGSAVDAPVTDAAKESGGG